MLKYPAMVHNDRDGMWIEFPDLKGCLTQGDTVKELILMAEDALSLYLGVIYDEDEEIPEPSKLKGKNVIYIDVLPHVAVPILLRKMRKEKGLSQTQIAEKIKSRYQTYQKFENVKKFNATVKTLEEVARALGKKLIIDFK